MAMAIRFVAKAVILLGLALISCNAQGDPLRDDLRRLLADTGATVFDVTKYGAVADGKTDNVEVLNAGPFRHPFACITFFFSPTSLFFLKLLSI